MPFTPFAKGHDPRRNLKGRVKNGVSIADMVRRIAAEPVSHEDKRTKLEAIVRATFTAAIVGDIKAVEFIAERGWGKVVQPIEQNNSGELRITARQMTDAELAAEIAALEHKIKLLESGEAEAETEVDAESEGASAPA